MENAIKVLLISDITGNGKILSDSFQEEVGTIPEQNGLSNSADHDNHINPDFPLKDDTKMVSNACNVNSARHTIFYPDT